MVHLTRKQLRKGRSRRTKQHRLYIKTHPLNLKHKRCKTHKRQKGGSSYFDHPWISSTPPSLLQRIGIAWAGEPAPISLDPTVSGYTLLS